MNIEDLFDEEFKEEKYKEPKKSIDVVMDKLMTNIESEFTGVNTDVTDRSKEKKETQEKLKAAEIKLQSLKNPHNLAKMTFTRRTEVSNKLSEARKKVRDEIKRYKVRLDEINIEAGDYRENESSTQHKKEDNTNSTDKWAALNPYSDVGIKY